MKCETCGSEMKWEGPLQGGFMVCWACKNSDDLNAKQLHGVQFYASDSFVDPPKAGGGEPGFITVQVTGGGGGGFVYPTDSDDPAPYDEDC